MYYTQLLLHLAVTFLVCAIVNVAVEELIFTTICQFYQYRKERERQRALVKGARTLAGKLVRLPGAYLPKLGHLAGYGLGVLRLLAGVAILLFLIVFLFNLWATLRAKQARTSESDCSIFMGVSVAVLAALGLFFLLASLKAQLNFRSSAKIYDRFHADYAELVAALRASQSSLPVRLEPIHGERVSSSPGLLGRFKKRLKLLQPAAVRPKLDAVEVVQQEADNLDRSLRSIAKLKLFYHLKCLNYKWSYSCSFAAAGLTLLLVVLRFCGCCYRVCVSFRPSMACFMRCYNFATDLAAGLPIAPLRLFRR